MIKSNQLMTVRLTGVLAEHFGEFHYFGVCVIQSTADVIRGLSANCPGFKRFLCNAEEYKFRVTHQQNMLGLERPEEILMPVVGDVVIRPVLTLGGGIGRALGGAALIAGSFFTGGLLSPLLLGIGASLLLGEASRLFSPQSRSTREDEERRRNRYFSSVTGRSQANTPVPLLLGEVRIEAPPIYSSFNAAYVDPNGDGVLEDDPGTFGIGDLINKTVGIEEGGFVQTLARL